ncbi:hypothetical protein [Lactococcus petauri]|uniref:Uncharacterized protein n=1 Tax=Lactococcus petauri TaxID=1940789 RepID=A0A252CFB6_9LACT|nr:hypothetical protein [Lactococcus petauri]OUK05235.1 hypothetical protein BZZ03_00525 [Lactococcus petauri]
MKKLSIYHTLKEKTGESFTTSKYIRFMFYRYLGIFFIVYMIQNLLQGNFLWALRLWYISIGNLEMMISSLIYAIPLTWLVTRYIISDKFIPVFKRLKTRGLDRHYWIYPICSYEILSLDKYSVIKRDILLNYLPFIFGKKEYRDKNWTDVALVLRAIMILILVLGAIPSLIFDIFYLNDTYFLQQIFLPVDDYLRYTAMHEALPKVKLDAFHHQMSAAIPITIVWCTLFLLTCVARSNGFTKASKFIFLGCLPAPKKEQEME